MFLRRPEDRSPIADQFSHPFHNVVAGRPRTAEGYRSLIRMRLKPTIGSVLLSKLTGAHIIELFAYLGGENGRRDGKAGALSAYSIAQTHRVLKKALRLAVKWGLLRHNPADTVDAPRLPQKEMRALTVQETQQLMDAVSGTPIGPLVTLAIYTGMRRSELLGLQWGDVNLDLATLSVVRALHRVSRGGLRYQEPKSRHGRRPIDLSPAAVLALRSHREQMEAKAAELGVALTDTTSVFARADLSPMRPDTVSHLFERLALKAGLGRVGIHALRHSHATLMLQQGIHPLVVSRRLGHANVQITLDTYSHLVPSIQRAAALAFEQGLRGVGEAARQRTPTG